MLLRLEPELLFSKGLFPFVEGTETQGSFWLRKTKDEIFANSPSIRSTTYWPVTSPNSLEQLFRGHRGSPHFLQLEHPMSRTLNLCCLFVELFDGRTLHRCVILSQESSYVWGSFRYKGRSGESLSFHQREIVQLNLKYKACGGASHYNQVPNFFEGYCCCCRCRRHFAREGCAKS